MAAVPRPRTVVVAAAGRHGSTAEIAARIESTLRSHLPSRWTVRLGDLADLRDMDDADALVLGSAVYLGHWLHPAVEAVEHVEPFTDLDLWLFSTGPLAETGDREAPAPIVQRTVDSGRAREHRTFGGRLETEHLAWWERLVARAVGAVSSDHRDWAAVDAWAAGIADQLTARVPAPEPRTR